MFTLSCLKANSTGIRNSTIVPELPINQDIPLIRNTVKHCVLLLFPLATNDGTLKYEGTSLKAFKRQKKGVTSVP